MKLIALAELVMDWKGVAFTLPNREMAADEILAYRSTLIDQSVKKNNAIPDGVKQEIKVPLETKQGITKSKKTVPNRLLLPNTTSLWTEMVNGFKGKVDFTSELDAQMSQYKALTGSRPRGYIKDGWLYIKNLYSPYIYMDSVFQNPLTVVTYRGEDPDEWEIEESLVGSIKAFLTPNKVQPTDGGAIRITEGDV